MPKTDEELLKHWDQDPDQSFQILYDRYSGVLLRFVYRFTGNQEQAEEILQDVFTEAFTAISNRRANLNLKAWLFTVAKNKSLNFEKKKKREILSEEIIASAPDDFEIEEQVSDAQLSRKLEECQNNLPKDLLNTWSLRKQGLDYQEIADRLDIPLGTVKSRFSRTTQSLEKQLSTIIWFMPHQRKLLS